MASLKVVARVRSSERPEGSDDVRVTSPSPNLCGQVKEIINEEVCKHYNYINWLGLGLDKKPTSSRALNLSATLAFSLNLPASFR